MQRYVLQIQYCMKELIRPIFKSKLDFEPMHRALYCYFSKFQHSSFSGWLNMECIPAFNSLPPFFLSSDQRDGGPTRVKDCPPYIQLFRLLFFILIVPYSDSLFPGMVIWMAITNIVDHLIFYFDRNCCLRLQVSIQSTLTRKAY